MEIDTLAPGIFLYKNVINNPDLLIEKIEKAVESEIIKWIPCTISGDFSGIYREIRDTVGIDIPYFDKPTTNNKNLLSAFEAELGTLFLESFGPLEDNYKKEFNLPFSNHEGYGILKYGVGQKFTNHVDDSPELPRRVSTVHYLNENYTGGEIVFPRFNLRYKPKENEMLIFPSSYVYNHYVEEVTSGTRYSVVSWIA